MSVRCRIELLCDFCQINSYELEGRATKASFFRDPGANGGWLINMGVQPSEAFKTGWDKIPNEHGQGASLRCPACAVTADRLL